jgi:tetratricopeptide (TPR) repeat protein
MWSFAIVAIEAVTGSLPFRAHTPEQLVGAILNEESSAWSAIDRVAPPNLSKILSKCLEKRPERRFSTFTELCKAWDDVIRLKGSPARAGWFSTDRRVSIDDGLIGDVWEEDIFPDRSARAKKIINEGDLNRVKEIYSFHALGEYDRVRQAARQLLGSPRQPGTYFHGFLSNTLEARPTLREARDRDPSVRKAFIFLSREMVVGVVGMWMRALIDWLGEHEPDRQSYQAAFDGALQELESLALWIASGEGVEHDLLVHAGQGLVISGNHERGERLLSEIVKGHPDDLRIWYALLVSLTRRGATETAERLIRYLLEQNKDTTGQTWQVFLAAGCSQIGDAEASVRWALLAHQSNQRDLEALYHVCLGLIALGRRPDADQFFRKMMALNPTSLRTRQVGASLGGVNSDGR